MTVPPSIRPSAPESSPQKSSPQDEIERHALRLGFFQRPWISESLPFITSLLLHATVIIIGVLTIKAIQVVRQKPTEIQTFVAESPYYPDQTPTPLRDPGFDRLPQPARQDTDPDVPPGGWKQTGGPRININDGDSRPGDPGDAPIGPGSDRLPGFRGAGPGGDAADGPLGRFGPRQKGGGVMFAPAPADHDASTVVYLCDCTGSMIPKIVQLKTELSRAVESLPGSKSFDVIFYHDDKVLKLDQNLIAATRANKRRFEAWLEDIIASGSTDPLPAITAALNLKPQVMFFLTDAADFPDVPAVKSAFTQLDANQRTHVNTILFVENKTEQEQNKDSEPLMRGISDQTHGVFKWVRIDDLNQ